MTKKTIIYVAFSILGLVLLKFAFTYFYNEWVKSKYNDGYYKENFSLLENMNFTERYIVYYNNGNVFYKQRNYQDAIDNYEIALEMDPPEEDDRDCQIRINLSLAKLALLPEEPANEEELDETIKVLKECLDILSEHECATEDGDGHNNRAQRLYDEIKQRLDELENQKEQSQQESDDSSNSDQSDTNESSQNEGSGGGSDSDLSSETPDSNRQSQMQSELSERMSRANEERQQQQRQAQGQAQDWNWYYDEEPVW